MQVCQLTYVRLLCVRGAVLMLVPTRELALQTSAIVKEIGKHMNVQCMVSTGGTTLKDDIMRLYNVVHILVSYDRFMVSVHARPRDVSSGCSWLSAVVWGVCVGGWGVGGHKVGTPGRVLDLANKGVADLSHCHTVIMDEADKLLSPEFQPILEQLLGHCMPNRQIGLFSATFPVAVKDFKVRPGGQTGQAGLA